MRPWGKGLSSGSSRFGRRVGGEHKLQCIQAVRSGGDNQAGSKKVLFFWCGQRAVARQVREANWLNQKKVGLKKSKENIGSDQETRGIF